MKFSVLSFVSACPAAFFRGIVGNFRIDSQVKRLRAGFFSFSVFHESCKGTRFLGVKRAYARFTPKNALLPIIP
jgi:hypothetical protein